MIALYEKKIKKITVLFNFSKKSKIKQGKLKIKRIKR